MFSEQLAWCRGENFTYALRSMILDRVDFPELDFDTYEILETTVVYASFCFLGRLCLRFQFTHSIRLQVDSND